MSHDLTDAEFRTRRTARADARALRAARRRDARRLPVRRDRAAGAARSRGLAAACVRLRGPAAARRRRPQLARAHRGADPAPPRGADARDRRGRLVRSADPRSSTTSNRRAPTTRRPASSRCRRRCSLGGRLPARDGELPDLLELPDPAIDVALARLYRHLPAQTDEEREVVATLDQEHPLATLDEAIEDLVIVIIADPGGRPDARSPLQGRTIKREDAHGSAATTRPLRQRQEVQELPRPGLSRG